MLAGTTYVPVIRGEREQGPYRVGALVDEIKPHVNPVTGRGCGGGLGEVVQIADNGRSAEIKCQKCKGSTREAV